MKNAFLKRSIREALRSVSIGPLGSGAKAIALRLPRRGPELYGHLPVSICFGEVADFLVKCRSWLVVARIGWVVLEFVTLDGLGLVEDRRVNVDQLGKDRTSNHADKSGSVSVSDGAFVGGEGFRVLV